jgi:hypothetical protein
VNYCLNQFGDTNSEEIHELLTYIFDGYERKSK